MPVFETLSLRYCPQNPHVPVPIGFDERFGLSFTSNIVRDRNTSGVRANRAKSGCRQQELLFVGAYRTTGFRICGGWTFLTGEFVGAKNKSKTRKNQSNPVEVVEGELFFVFKQGQGQGQGPGKPSLNEAYLRACRDKLIWQIEPNWHEIGRALETASSPDDIRKAFEVVTADGKTADHLAPVLRVSSQPATSDVIEQTREKLGEVNAGLYKLNEEHQRALQAHRDSEQALSPMSEPFERDLRRDLALREENIREIKIQLTGAVGKIRGIELQRTKTGESQARQEELRTLRSELDKLETDLAADFATCIRLRKRLALITPENRQIASEEASKRKGQLDAAETICEEIRREQVEYENALADQEAFYFRQQILQFVQQCKPAASTGKQRYALTPRNVANAIAGLPYVTARRSAEICAKLATTVPEMRNYRVFTFVKSVWTRRHERGALSLTEWFKREIKKLPKFELAERNPNIDEEGENKKKRMPNQFRIYLGENWYYLKKAVEECSRLKLALRDMPYEITKKFIILSMHPETPVEPIRAERERITD